MADKSFPTESSLYMGSAYYRLRLMSKKKDYDQACKELCEKKPTESQYAEAIRKLTTEYWIEYVTDCMKTVSRMSWIHYACVDYFVKGELKKQRIREKYVLLKLKNPPEMHLMPYECHRYRLLDVGSRYNSFELYDLFRVVALDIDPITSNVFQCDFLNVNISEKYETEDNSILSLERNSFEVVVFSLLLACLPLPEQRLLCCKKAYDLLKYEGLLVIITPDLRNANVNAKYMKSWRYALALIGFSRIKHEKIPDMHCMLFRKAISCRFSIRWAKMHENEGLHDTIFIPQDFQKEKRDERKVEVLDYTTDQKKNFFSEMPFSWLC